MGIQLGLRVMEMGLKMRGREEMFEIEETCRNKINFSRSIRENNNYQI